LERLFNKYCAENELGRQISNEICKEIVKLTNDICSKYPNVDLNDLENVICGNVDCVMAEKRLKFAMTLRKIEKGD